ncbi:Hypothetical_protein [Hexamita inflata]|uniref:Hypothetical_protein n=1 Tax=Hexamita inflata TaxID=28002 RepID=A0AA86UAK7_9EUKA|nr:Hypothetical protein HINF_LOCUS31397 [Hexamita inflata]
MQKEYQVHSSWCGECNLSIFCRIILISYLIPQSGVERRAEGDWRGHMSIALGHAPATLFVFQVISRSSHSGVLNTSSNLRPARSLHLVESDERNEVVIGLLVFTCRGLSVFRRRLGRVRVRFLFVSLVGRRGFLVFERAWLDLLFLAFSGWIARFSEQVVVVAPDLAVRAVHLRRDLSEVRVVLLEQVLELLQVFFCPDLAVFHLER